MKRNEQRHWNPWSTLKSKYYQQKQSIVLVCHFVGLYICLLSSEFKIRSSYLLLHYFPFTLSSRLFMISSRRPNDHECHTNCECCIVFDTITLSLSLSLLCSFTSLSGVYLICVTLTSWLFVLSTWHTAL